MESPRVKMTILFSSAPASEEFAYWIFLLGSIAGMISVLTELNHGESSAIFLPGLPPLTGVVPPPSFLSHAANDNAIAKISAAETNLRLDLFILLSPFPHYFVKNYCRASEKIKSLNI